MINPDYEFLSFEPIEIQEDMIKGKNGEKRERAHSLLQSSELKKIFKYVSQREMLEIVEQEEIKKRTIKQKIINGI